MALKVEYHPLAVEDLDRIDDFIAQDSPTRAIEYVRRIQAQCAKLDIFPHRGRLWPELEGEIRTVAFEGSAVIAYRIEAERVTILRVFYAGQDFEDVLLKSQT